MVLYHYSLRKTQIAMIRRPIHFKYAVNASVRVGRLRGTVTSRVPCKPKPMYYVRLLDREPVLLEEDELRAV